jgi:hypothetical protein
MPDYRRIKTTSPGGSLPESQVQASIKNVGEMVKSQKDSFLASLVGFLRRQSSIE